jgi:hypothetical protein
MIIVAGATAKPWVPPPSVPAIGPFYLPGAELPSLLSASINGTVPLSSITTLIKRFIKERFLDGAPGESLNFGQDPLIPAARPMPEIPD